MRKKPASSIASLFADGYGRTGGCLVWEFEAVFGRTEGENLPFLSPPASLLHGLILPAQRARSQPLLPCTRTTPTAIRHSLRNTTADGEADAAVTGMSTALLMGEYKATRS